MTFNYAAALSIFLAAGTPPGSSGPAMTPIVQEMAPVIPAAKVKAMLAADPKLVVVDVRQPEEYAAGHIEGAILMPLGTLESAYRKLPRDAKLIVYCRAGHRSAKAVAFLIAHGYAMARSLDGGFVAFSALPQ